MMTHSFGDGRLCPDSCAQYFCNSTCNPSGELGMSIFNGLVDWLDRCFVSSTPYGTLWVSTFILCHVFDVEVSEV